MNFKLPTQIVISMILGVLTGVLLRENAVIFQPVGDMFIRLLKMIIVPLIFSSLVVGVVSLGNVQSLGRLGTRTFFYYLATTVMAVLIGLIVVNFIKPGIGSTFDLSVINTTSVFTSSISDEVTFLSVLVNIVPDNVVSAIVKENMLGIIFFSLIFGAALLSMEGEGNLLKDFVTQFNNVFLKITNWIMQLSPIGVFALLASLVGQTGFVIFKPVTFYVATVLIAIFIHLGITLSGFNVPLSSFSLVGIFFLPLIIIHIVFIIPLL